MPFAVTHILVVLILLELYRTYFVKNKQAFPLHYVLIGGIAGLLPDLDLALSYFLNLFGYDIYSIHRVFLHNIFVPLALILLALLFSRFKNKKLAEHHLKLRNIFLILTFAVTVHLILDATVSGKIYPFWPLSDYRMGLNLLSIYVPKAWQDNFLQVVDGTILVIWLIHREIKYKLSRLL